MERGGHIIAEAVFRQAIDNMHNITISFLIHARQMRNAIFYDAMLTEGGHQY